MTFNDLLIGAAEFVLGAWDGVKAFFVALGGAFDYLLQPVLSPVLRVINPICTLTGDAVYGLLNPLPIWLGLTIISIVVGIVMLIAFRYTSNQVAIGRAKDDIKANLLVLKLYKDELRVVFRSQLRLLWAILRLQRYVLTPVLIMLVPMLLILAQMGVRYQWRPARLGESTLVTINQRNSSPTSPPIELEPSAAVTLEAGPVPGGGRIVWRLSGKEVGRHTLRFRAGPTIVEKELVVGEGVERVSALRPARRWTDQLLHPVESPIPSDSTIESITIAYPPVDSWIYGSNVWVVTFFVISMAAALILKPVFRVKF